MRRISAFALVLTIGLIGCGGGSPVAGTWTVQAPANMPKGSTMEAVFTDPDKFSLTLDIQQRIPDGSIIKIHGDVSGTYKLEGENMSMTASDAKFTGSGFPAAIKAMAEKQMESMGQQVKDEINKGGVTKFKKVSDDSFTLTGKTGTPQTFTRKK